MNSLDQSAIVKTGPRLLLLLLLVLGMAISERSSPAATNAEVAATSAGPAPARTGSSLGKNLWVLAKDSWKDAGLFAGKVIGAGVLWAAVLTVGGCALGWSVWHLFRKRGLLSLRYRWYRYCSWLWWVVYVAGFALGLGYAGGSWGMGRAVKHGLNEDRIADRLVANLYVAAALDAANYQLKGTEQAEEIRAAIGQSEQLAEVLSKDLGHMVRETCQAQAAAGRLTPRQARALQWIADSPVGKLVVGQGTKEENRWMVVPVLFALSAKGPQSEAFLKENPQANVALAAVTSVLDRVRRELCKLVSSIVFAQVLFGILAGVGTPLGLTGVFLLVRRFVLRQNTAPKLPPVIGCTIGVLLLGQCAQARDSAAPAKDGYAFDRTISRTVLENYLARSITMEGLLNGHGDLDDNLRMLKSTGAKFIGRSLCLWGGEAALLPNLERAKQQSAKVRAADPDMILQACIFEIVTIQADQVPVPEWAFAALGLPVEKRNFRYADMLYPDGRFKDHWRTGQSVPDVSRTETKLWFFFLGASFIDAGCEAIHLGQTELMNKNDSNLDHYAQVLDLIRAYAARHARRHLVLYDSHVPSGGLVRQGRLLMDFHSFPLRIMEVPDKPQEAVLKLGFSDGIYGRSKGGTTFSGWSCEHLPYLVEIDNWGVSRQPGQPKAGGIWIWGYDEITWFAHQSRQYRSNWLAYARDWVRRTDTNAFLEMPGSRTLASPVDGKRWYYANNPSSAVPDGFGDEDAIRTLWATPEKR